MSTSINSQTTVTVPNASSDAAVLAAMVKAVESAGAHLLTRFDRERSAPTSLGDVVDAIHANDNAALALLRGPLQAARPQAGWVEDELEGGPLPAGEWWLVDPVEGNINHVQGLPDAWGVSATLVRNNLPVLTAVHVPITGTTYTAVRGGGAFQDGERLRVSAKSDLRAALVATGQAKPGEDAETYRRIGESVTAMLNAALVVRVTVPATFQLVAVARGSLDAFWQHSQVRSGLAAGALLVAEADGTVTDMAGQPWTVASKNFLASAPGVHAAARQTLATVA
jgi:myo-inositol-1(or 4)-monophosphatase